MANKAAVAAVCILAIVGIAFGAVALVHADDAKKTADDAKDMVDDKGSEIAYTFYIGLGDVDKTQADNYKIAITNKIKEDNRFGYTVFLAEGSTHLDTGYVDDKYTVVVKIAMVTDEKGVLELADALQKTVGKIVLVEKSYADYQLLGI